MIFPKDEELFRDIPGKRNQRIYDSSKASDSAKGEAEPIRDVYNRVYRETADKLLAKHNGRISSSYTDSLIHKDLSEIALALDRALREHLDKTDGYIGAFPESSQYYATVDHAKDYHFYYLGQCMTYYYSPLLSSLGDLNRLVCEEIYTERIWKSLGAMAFAVLSMAAMWFFRDWYFIYEGLSAAKIGALAVVFCGLFGLTWWSHPDPTEFALKNGYFDSPFSTVLGFGLLGAVVVRIFLSGSTAALICCGIAAVCVVRYIYRILAARKHLGLIRTRSPKLRELSLYDCKRFERDALSLYRMLRFLELWYESEDNKKSNQYLASLRPNMMRYVDEYEQWRRKYLKDDEGF